MTLKKDRNGKRTRCTNLKEVPAKYTNTIYISQRKIRSLGKDILYRLDTMRHETQQ